MVRSYRTNKQTKINGKKYEPTTCKVTGLNSALENMKATHCIHVYIHSTLKVYARDRRCAGARGVSSRALIRLKSSLKDLIIFPFARQSPSLHVLALFDDK